LVDVRLAPASERLEVVEVGLSIVVGPPEGILAHSVPVDAHDALPVVVVRVDSDLVAHGDCLIRHVQNELSVRRLTGSPVVDLDVEPYHTDLRASVLHVVDRSRHL
ncbi:hypothetical protein PMAYCL1PPCAC_15572, partial [Pristionchus mayeri]